MPTLEYREKMITIDEDGYLVDFEEWNEEVARGLAARAEAGELPAESIAILRFIRDYYRKYNFFPMVNAICKRVQEPKGCVTQKFLNPLIAWKLAGLPHPEEPIVSLLEAGQSPG